jgi:hypothetical protein
MNEAAKMGYKVLVIDSLSHAWRELTEEVDRITQASKSNNSLLSWGKVSPKQKRLIETILSFPGHIIATMRSKTDWVVTQTNGKIVSEKLGLAPEQGKGIEYEFDLLVELNQQHIATVTKDRTGKFQDESFEKPGEDFGEALYDWLMSGVAAETETTIPTVTQIVSGSDKAVTPQSKSGNTLKEKSDAVIKEIGNIVTAVDNGHEYFTEDERNEARELIKNTKLNENGIKELFTLKEFLADELSKRSKKAA